MKAHHSLLSPLIMMLSMLLPGCGGGGGDSSAQNPSACAGYTECAQIEGLNYAVYAPQNLAQGAPLLVILHGASTGRSTTESMWQARLFADTYGYLLAIPSAGTWNYSSDQERVITLIDRLQGDYPVGDAVYLAGWSNGSELSQFLACDHAERITGVISYAGPLDAHHVCQPSQPLAVMMVHGNQDEVVNYGGGTFGTMGHMQAFALWRGLNQCGETVESSSQPLETGRTSIIDQATDCAKPTWAITNRGGRHYARWDASQWHPVMAEFFARAAQ